MTRLVQTASAAETRSVARSLGETLRRGDMLALSGDLGSGKTQFVKGLCEALGVAEPVTSPTFVLLNRYQGSDAVGKELLVYHFDLYRLERPEELTELGLEEFLSGDGLCIVEWAEKLGTMLPAIRYDVVIAFGDGDDARTIRISNLAGSMTP